MAVPTSSLLFKRPPFRFITQNIIHPFWFGGKKGLQTDPRPPVHLPRLESTLRYPFHSPFFYHSAPRLPWGRENCDHFCRAGINCRSSVITAGPKITTIKAGKIKKTSGGTIFTVVFALASSSRCLRFMRKSSE